MKRLKGQQLADKLVNECLFIKTENALLGAASTRSSRH